MMSEWQFTFYSPVQFICWKTELATRPKFIHKSSAVGLQPKTQILHLFENKFARILLIYLLRVLFDEKIETAHYHSCLY